MQKILKIGLPASFGCLTSAGRGLEELNSGWFPRSLGTFHRGRFLHVSKPKRSLRGWFQHDGQLCYESL